MGEDLEDVDEGDEDNEDDEQDVEENDNDLDETNNENESENEDEDEDVDNEPNESENGDENEEQSEEVNEEPNEDENEDEIEESAGADADEEEEDEVDIEEEVAVDEYIETAICLHGRTEGQHQEIGDEDVSYCFTEYDDAFNKPVYKGEFGEIRWTSSAGSYGGSYGLFLYGEEWPIAYCFSEDAKDISVCDRQWFVDHGTSARYYKDDTMESKECECSVDGFDLFDVETTMMPQTTGEDDEDAADSSSASTTESWSTVSSTGTIPSAGVNALETSNANKYGMSLIGIMLLSALAWLNLSKRIKISSRTF